MIKVKFRHLEAIYKGINELNDCKMQFKTKLKLRDIQEKLEKETEWFEKQRLELLNTYSKKNEEGKPIIENNNYVLDNSDEFIRRFEELLNTEFDIQPLECELIENLELSGRAWDGLFHILERGENVNEG